MTCPEAGLARAARRRFRAGGAGPFGVPSGKFAVARFPFDVLRFRTLPRIRLPVLRDFFLAGGTGTVLALEDKPPERPDCRNQNLFSAV